MTKAFDLHSVALASVNVRGPVDFRLEYTAASIRTASIIPLSHGLNPGLSEDAMSYRLDEPRDIMLQLNDTKWLALHLLANPFVEEDEDVQLAENPNAENSTLPGLNNCPASVSSRITDGVNLFIPSNTTVYLAPGAFTTYRMNSINVSHSTVRATKASSSAQKGATATANGEAPSTCLAQPISPSLGGRVSRVAR